MKSLSLGKPQVGFVCFFLITNVSILTLQFRGLQKLEVKFYIR